MPLLDVRDLHVQFGDRSAVSGVSFSLEVGQRVALVGESGSGKSVTAMALLGLLPETARVSGQVLWNGQSLLNLAPKAWQNLRGTELALVSQEPMTALNPLMTVGEQLVEVFEQKKALSKDLAKQSAIDLIKVAELPEPEQMFKQHPHQLSGGQRQRVMLAMAMANNPKLLFADEPTTALDAMLRLHMMDWLLREQKDRGMAVVIISHDLPLVRRFAQHVIVMQNGRVVEQGATEELFANPQHPYTQQLLNSRPARRAPQQQAQQTTAPVLQAQGLSVDYPRPLPGWRGWLSYGKHRAVGDVNFALRPGRTLGVVGESGSGKSTLALAALGLIPFEGEVLVQGQPWAKKLPAAKPQRRVVQVVFQDPFSSLSPRMTVSQLVGEGLDIHHPQASAEQRQARVLQALVDVGLLTASQAQTEGEVWLQRFPHEFSGGQRQRLAIARALVVEPQVLVLDEPTSALDVSIQKHVLELLQHLQREKGLAYLLITHDMSVVQAMADEVMVLKSGQVVEQGDWDTVSTQPQHPYTQALLAHVQA